MCGERIQYLVLILSEVKYTSIVKQYHCVSVFKFYFIPIDMVQDATLSTPMYIHFTVVPILILHTCSQKRHAYVINFTGKLHHLNIWSFENKH